MVVHWRCILCGHCFISVEINGRYLNQTCERCNGSGEITREVKVELCDLSSYLESHIPFVYKVVPFVGFKISLWNKTLTYYDENLNQKTMHVYSGFKTDDGSMVVKLRDIPGSPASFWEDSQPAIS